MESHDIQRMKELAALLGDASRAYYQESEERMSNFEYDRLYDELASLEAKTGTVLAGSPTQKVGYEVLSELPKEAHPSPMLSLDKTKDVGALVEWLGAHEGLLSWKLDGLTIVLTYAGGRLIKAVTRGNGEIGEVVTPNARTFANLPLQIPFRGELTLRGEAIITYSDFERVNREIEDVDAKYKNPRNLCSGSVRQLNSAITASRHVRFMAFALVEARPTVALQGHEGANGGNGACPDAVQISMDVFGAAPVTMAPGETGLPHPGNSRKAQMEWLAAQGFETVGYKMVDHGTLEAAVGDFAKEVAGNDFPSDGLVLTFEDIAYGESLGQTAKFPRNSIAFKWRDEVAETTLREIEWSPSRTGLINPVAIFDPVELEGTTVTRASVHNISVMESLGLCIGDRITVYKANMIIPQIAENLSCESGGGVEIPGSCPVCGRPTTILDSGGVRTLYCKNPDCPAKQIKQFTHLVSRNALNVDGMSEATLEKFIGAGFIREYADIFRLDRYRDQIVAMDGFGEKSFENIIASARAASRTTLPRLVYGLGVPGIGLAGAKMLCRAFGNDFGAMRGADGDSLTQVEGIGDVLAQGWRGYFDNAANNIAVDNLLAMLNLDAGPGRMRRPAPGGDGVPGAAGWDGDVAGSVRAGTIEAAGAAATAGNVGSAGAAAATAGTIGAAGAAATTAGTIEAAGAAAGVGNASSWGGIDIHGADAFATEAAVKAAPDALSGKTFVITGSLNHFENREALQDLIESLGGKSTGSVTGKTGYLINNDVNSSSSKNKKARELGVPVISEEDFLGILRPEMMRK
ncbi:MAG: NAD-dependent DNA ligase LigA [Lachnospiraceae bacterium]|jgi:DNA ligase (NAD+)|nr:NAD-dependent DNA ligase LigA [Lachnospiraceae bacterium]